METNGIVCYMRNLLSPLQIPCPSPQRSPVYHKSNDRRNGFRNPERIPHTDGAEDTA